MNDYYELSGIHYRVEAEQDGNSPATGRIFFKTKIGEQVGEYQLVLPSTYRNMGDAMSAARDFAQALITSGAAQHLAPGIC